MPPCSSTIRQLHGIVGPREPTFALTDGTMRAVTPNSDHGPFRVSLLRRSTTSDDLNYAASGLGAAGASAAGAACAQRRPAASSPTGAGSIR